MSFIRLAHHTRLIVGRPQRSVRTTSTLAACLVPIVFATACAGGSPASPTPAPTPAPAPAPAPAPTAQVTFVADAGASTGRTFSLAQVEASGEEAVIALRANRFGGMPDGEGTLVYARATLTFDAALVSLVNFQQGDFMKQGDTASFSVTGGAGSVTVRVDRQSQVVNGASGSGDVVLLRFRRVAGATGQTRITFTDAKGYWGNYHDYLDATAGGTLTAR